MSSDPVRNPAYVYRVAVFAPADDPAELRDVLIRVLGLNAVDAQIHVRAVPGLLPDRMSHEKGAELVQAIGDLGLTAEVIREDDLPVLDEDRQVHHLRLVDEGLQTLGLSGEVEATISWDQLDMLSIGYVPLDEPEHRYITDTTAVIHSAPTGMAHRSLDVVKSGPEAWIVYGDSEHGFRIDHQEMNYEYMGERMSTSATANFRQLVDDLLARAPGLFLTPATRAYVEHGFRRHYEFDSSEELRQYTMFQLLLRRRLPPARE
ncbi:hypothetical protein Mal4_01790 [Maioricimonas rarisocia]|uniref:Uncharacterized protein n=1 Tax=Maioricimonas rarisocia TaxID=2528026 RepID=A0A517Z088_9PLAN|nr:hypothetical protein [Maioricimonas rarisocia]QDU35897.1 hypothetical protein Mal4_01790 [Maioricimonas rarisocia]